MNRYVAIITIVLLLIGGYFAYEKFIRKPVVVVYIENNSFAIPEVDIEIRVDDSLLVSNLVRWNSVQPSFSIRQLKLNKGRHVFSVLSRTQSINTIDTVDLKEDKYIFVSFNYKLKTRFAYEQEKWRFEQSYPKEKYPDKTYEFDSVAIKPEIKIGMMNEEPILM